MILTRAYEFGEDISDGIFDETLFHRFFDENEGAWYTDFEEGVLSYMGVQTQNGNYGWIAVIRDRMNFSAVGWAYETTPGKTILAGEIPAPGAGVLFGLGLLIRKRRRAE